MTYMDDEQLPLEEEADLMLEEHDPEDDPAGEPDNDPSAEAWSASGLFADQTDEQVVSKAQQGDAVAVEYLLGKYKNFVTVGSLPT